MPVISSIPPVYPCTYRELLSLLFLETIAHGISLYLQGTPGQCHYRLLARRYIPVPTGNSSNKLIDADVQAVYPCTYRELLLSSVGRFESCGISLYLQGTQRASAKNILFFRYIPVPTGNSFLIFALQMLLTVYPCTYRELCCD